MAEVIFSQHAKDALEERAIDEAWVRRVALEPEWEAADPVDGRVRRFGTVQERESRILRVVCEPDGDSHDRDCVPGSERQEALMAVRMTYDAEVNAAYLRFSSAPVLESEEVSEGVVIDYDAEGRMVGMEVLNARKHLPMDALVAAE